MIVTEVQQVIMGGATTSCDLEVVGVGEGGMWMRASSLEHVDRGALLLVEEEELLVRGEGPQVGGHDGLGGVSGGARVVHRLEAGLDRGGGGLEAGHERVEVARVLDRRDD